ncbi:hypothetical protein [Bradyrhizobium manausense]|uniref:DUF4314 domain-containing protein n=1 Tax=Bradyrhizobium manausense TaxID=989370 RepID=A0A0R3D0E7_9BRAD|nr:hypothetical protein [Bradyrhizobium manausense]KRQ03289.1 hypothetical protein AOQ71_31675 [Bradyrhizobium manausense]
MTDAEKAALAKGDRVFYLNLGKMTAGTVVSRDDANDRITINWDDTGMGAVPINVPGFWSYANRRVL